MNAIIVIEIVAGLVLLYVAVRFAIRDTRERSGSGADTEVEATDIAATPAPAPEPATAAQLSEAGSTETS